jgi:uncharacterized protein
MIEQLLPNGYQHYLVGGVLLGIAVAFAFAMSGLVTGMSTVFSSTWSYVSQLSFFQQERLVTSRGWRLALAVGLIIGAVLYLVTVGGGTTFQTSVSGWQLAIGGFIAGFGARLSNGCTSGHGICGMGSLKLPSLLAVITFLATAFITANVVKALGGV